MKHNTWRNVSVFVILTANIIYQIKNKAVSISVLLSSLPGMEIVSATYVALYYIQIT
jgi:hypothetical protein